LQKTLDILQAVCYNIITARENPSELKNKGVVEMKNQKEKPTTFQIATLIIEAVTALAALITAIKWW